MNSYPSYTWDKVGREITIPIYNELRKFNEKFPPTYQLICAYFGFTGTGEASKTKGKKEVSASVMGMLKADSKGQAPQPRFI